MVNCPEGGDHVIVYVEILQRLADAGWSAYRLGQARKLSESTLQRLRHGRPVSTETIDVVCGLLRCQPGDLLRWVPDREGD